MILAALSVAAQAQTTCRDTPEGQVCTDQQQLIAGALVSLQVQQNLGLVTVGNGCSGTLVNRFWVLTADHCVTTKGAVNGPAAALTAVPITAAWSNRTVIPTRFVRNWGVTGLDVALIFLGAGDFAMPNIQLFNVGDIDTTQTLTKFGRGIYAYASAGPPAVPAQQDGLYRSGVFTASNVGVLTYTLPVNAAGQVGNGGDSGGPDFVTAPNGVTVGIAGVQSTCRYSARVPGAPPAPPASPWPWVTAITSCNSAPISAVRDDIVKIIQEGRIPCPDASAACAVAETTSLTLMLR